VSAAFLILLGVVNVWILVKLVQHLRNLCNTPLDLPASDPSQPNTQSNLELDLKLSTSGGGCMTRLLKTTFRLIDRPWKMYPLGILFGLGFDTSSEIALLGISALSASAGTSIWLILIFPVLFTAGMCLLDTIDGAAMMALYTSARLAKDQIKVAYFQVVLTGVTVVVAVVIGVIQLLSMIDAVAQPQGKFWEGVERAGDNYDVIGTLQSFPSVSLSCPGFIRFFCHSLRIYRFQLRTSS